MKNKQKLLTPGPTPIPERVLNAISSSAGWHHRTPEFKEIFNETSKAYGDLVGSKEQVIFLAGTGTLGMETAVKNICTRGEKLIYINSGKFGERWGLIAKELGINAIEILIDPGSEITEEVINSTLEKHKDAVAFYFQIVETSTAAYIDPNMISSLVKNKIPQAMLIADGITAVGAMKVKQEELGIDVLISGSQKALMLPPGLAILSLSAKAWERVDKVECGSLYANLKIEKDYQVKGSSAWTPAISLIFGLKEALNLIKEEGEENLYLRHENLAKLTRNELKQLGFSLFASCPAVSVTSAFSDTIDVEKLRSELLASSGIRIAGGQSELKGKIFRIGHMGYVFEPDIREALNALRNIIN